MGPSARTAHHQGGQPQSLPVYRAKQRSRNGYLNTKQTNNTKMLKIHSVSQCAVSGCLLLSANPYVSVLNVLNLFAMNPFYKSYKQPFYKSYKQPFYKSYRQPFQDNQIQYWDQWH